jgi:hypothetical protein
VRAAHLGVGLLFGATLAHAQVAPNRNSQRLFVTEVADAPSVWVNPGALAMAGNLSVALDLTVGNPGSAGRLDQISASFNSHRFAFGYQRDRLGGGATGHTYRVVLWGTDGRLSLGLAGTQYSGGQGGRAVDIGVLYLLSPQVSLGGVLANIGQPIVRGDSLRLQLTPAVAVHTTGRGMAILSQATVNSDNIVGFAFGVQATVPLRLPVRVLARVDTDGDFGRTAFAFGLTVGGLDRVGLLASTPGDADRISAASLHGASARPVSTTTRGR